MAYKGNVIASSDMNILRMLWMKLIAEWESKANQLMQ